MLTFFKSLFFLFISQLFEEISTFVTIKFFFPICNFILKYFLLTTLFHWVWRKGKQFTEAFFF